MFIIWYCAAQSYSATALKRCKDGDTKNLDIATAAVDDEYNEPPPTYEEAVESPYTSRVQPVEDSETFELLTNATSTRPSESGPSSRWKATARTPVPTKPLQL
ncbi:hypothetical protein AC579_6912, partial [Pseudocercospora musae]